MAKKSAKGIAKQVAKSTTQKEIEDALFVEGCAFYQAFQKRHAKESVYSFLFEISSVGYTAAAAIGTEESLAKYAEEIAEDFDDDVQQAIAELRWAGPENGCYQSTDKQFQQSNKLLEIAEDTELYPEYDGTLEQIALSAIKRMEEDVVFGAPEVRSKIVLGICHTGGDNSEEEFIKWASAVNPPVVVKRLKAQLKLRG
ncbi:MAG: DUF4303 domain-containing protein [Planctomycetaceae bacterium]